MCYCFRLPVDDRMTVKQELQPLYRSIGMATTHVTYHTMKTEANTILMRRDIRLKKEPEELRGELRALPFDSAVLFPGYKVKQEAYLQVYLCILFITLYCLICTIYMDKLKE